MYSVKEIFYTLQGEGAQSGRPAVFMRFSGCNLWTGREQDRDKAVCKFCDTDFVGTDGVNGGQFAEANELALKAVEVAGCASSGLVDDLLIVLTGGEPLLQVDDVLIKALQAAGFEVAVETNGTIKAPSSLDWICVSPKAGSDIVQRFGDELKLVFGQENFSPEDIQAFTAWDFDHFYLQPMDCKDIDRFTKETIDYCKSNPKWKLSLQTHKLLQIP